MVLSPDTTITGVSAQRSETKRSTSLPSSLACPVEQDDVEQLLAMEIRASQPPLAVTTS